jgi:acetolactate synthase-1/3 small subunit
MPMPEVMTTTFILQVQNDPNSLARVVMLFHRRAIRIASLTMEPTITSGTLRIELTAIAHAGQAQRMTADLHKLVNVLFVEKDNPS